MSLDVYLTAEEPTKREGSGIFLRENGTVREVTRFEWDARFPGAEPVAATYDEPDRTCLLYTSPSPRDKRQSRMPSSA